MWAVNDSNRAIVIFRLIYDCDNEIFCRCLGTMSYYLSICTHNMYECSAYGKMGDISQANDIVCCALWRCQRPRMRASCQAPVKWNQSEATRKRLAPPFDPEIGDGVDAGKSSSVAESRAMHYLQTVCTTHILKYTIECTHHAISSIWCISNEL